MQFLLLSFSVFLLLCSTRAIPFAEPLQERQTERPKFINEDGTLDIVNLVAASRITPNNLAPSYPSNFTIDVANSLNDAVQQAQDQQSAQVDNNSKRGFFDGCPSKLNIPSTFGNWLVPQALSTWLFSNWPTFSASANKASTTLSNGKYKQVYKNLQASYVNPSANTFLGMSTLWSYNPEACAARCNNVKGCISFEVYYERDPSVDPTVSSKCSNPISVTNIVCSYHGAPISSDLATDSGSTLGKFKVLKAGVNGYTLAQYVPPVLPGYVGAVRPGLVDNRVSTGQGSLAGPQYADYTTYSIMYTAVLTKNAYFDPAFCKAVADTNSATKSFSTWPLTVGGDPNSTPFAGAGGRYIGQGCILYSVSGFPAETFNDVGQYGHDPETGNPMAFFSHAPNFHYDAKK